MSPDTSIAHRDRLAPRGLTLMYLAFAYLCLGLAFLLLASVEDPSFGLVLVDPCVFVPDYLLTLSPEDLAPLPADDPDRLEVLVPVVLPTEESALSLNLRGPLVFASADHRGVQRVSPDESHAVRHSPDPARLDAPSPSCSS